MRTEGTPQQSEQARAESLSMLTSLDCYRENIALDKS